MELINYVIKDNTNQRWFDFLLQEVLKSVYFVYRFDQRYTVRDIDDMFCEAFGDWMSDKSKSAKDNQERSPDATIIGYSLVLDLQHEGKDYQGATDPLTTSLWPYKDSDDTFSLKFNPNFFSDYPRNKRTGELMDFSAFAYKNREKLERSMRKLEELVEGEIQEWEPKVGDYGENKEYMSDYDLNTHDWTAKEIHRYGYLPLTERKAEYDGQ